MGTLANPAKSGSWDARPGPITGMAWDTALQGHILGIYVTPLHPTSHVASRACTQDAHFMPCCMRCAHAAWRAGTTRVRVGWPHCAAWKRPYGRFNEPRWPVGASAARNARTMVHFLLSKQYCRASTTMLLLLLRGVLQGHLMLLTDPP